MVSSLNNPKQPIQLKKVKRPARWFLVISLLAFIGLTLAIAGMGLWSAWQQANQNVNQRLTSSLTYLSSWLEDQNTANKIAAEGLASQRNIVAALIQHERGKPELDRLLTVGLLRKLSVSFIAFVDTDRKIITSEPTNLPPEWLPKTVVEAALAGQPLPAEPELGQNKLLLTASASVQNENQTVGAVILGDLLDDTTTTAVELKRATGLDVAIVLKGKLQTTTLPFPTTAGKDTSTLAALPDLSEIETVLKSQDQLIRDLRLNNNQAYKVGYKAILSNRFLIGEVLILFPQTEIDQIWWNQATPILIVLFFSWLVGGLLLFYLFNNYYLPLLALDSSATPNSLSIITDTYHRKDQEASNNLASSVFSVGSLPVYKNIEEEVAQLVPRPDNLEPNLDLTPDIALNPGPTSIQTEYQSGSRLEQARQLEKLEEFSVSTPLLAPNRQSEEAGEKAEWAYFGKLAINRAAYEAQLDGQPLSMTRTEFELLGVLASRPNKVVSRNELINLVWGEDYLGEPGTVDAHISNLRRKVEGDPLKPTMIVTVRGVGYKFQPPV